MDLYPDFRDFIQLLNAEHVKYLVGGGYAKNSYAAEISSFPLHRRKSLAAQTIAPGHGLEFDSDSVHDRNHGPRLK